MKCHHCGKSDEVVTRPDGTKYCLDCGERVALGPSDAAACSPSSVVSLVRRYNRWRKGDDDLEMENPKQIGEALDAICDLVEKLQRHVEDGKRNGQRCAEERDRLQDAVRAFRNAKGRYHTQKACERLIALLPENANCPSVDANEKAKS